LVFSATEASFQRSKREFMPCDYPRNALLSPRVDGKYPKPQTYLAHLPFEDVLQRLNNDPLAKGRHLIQLKCGKCKGCKLDYASQMTTRMMDEFKTFPLAMFVTLTYDDEHLPFGGTLCKNDLSRFIERLRHHVDTNSDLYPNRKEVMMPNGKLAKPLRYYSAGEYGELEKRPHYHLIIYNLWFNDALEKKKNKTGDWLYTSPTLTKLWGKGLCDFGKVTAESCGYTARYAQKKVYGDLAKEHYKKTILVDALTGEVIEIELVPEFATMSTQPGLGYFYYQDTKEQIDGLDKTTITNKKGTKWINVPRYYNKLLQKENPEKHIEISDKRLEKMRNRDTHDPLEKSTKRVQTKAEFRDLRTEQLKRRI